MGLIPLPDTAMLTGGEVYRPNTILMDEMSMDARKPSRKNMLDTHANEHFSKENKSQLIKRTVWYYMALSQHIGDPHDNLRHKGDQQQHDHHGQIHRHHMPAGTLDGGFTDGTAHKQRTADRRRTKPDGKVED